MSAGIRHCRIWGEQAQLPHVKGLILISGAYDLIKQLRTEVKLGIEDGRSWTAAWRFYHHGLLTPLSQCPLFVGLVDHPRGPLFSAGASKA